MAFPRGQKGDIVLKGLGEISAVNTQSRSVGLWVYKLLLLEEVKALLSFGVVRVCVCLHQVWVQMLQAQLQLSPVERGRLGESQGLGGSSPECSSFSGALLGRTALILWQTTVGRSACTRPPLAANPAPLIGTRNAIGRGKQQKVHMWQLPTE